MKRERIGIGIDAGGTFTKLIAVSESGKVLGEDSVPTERERGPRPFIRRVAAAVHALERDTGRGGAAGLAVAGDVDSERGVLRRSPNLAPFEGYTLRKAMAAALERPVTMHNDANMAAWGCYALELKRRCPNVVAITMGTGIGGGLVLDGRLYAGPTGSAGEIGHMRVTGDGFPCACGARGCLEAHAGSYGIRRTVKQLLRERPHARSPLREPGAGRFPERASEAARRGDPLAREVWRRVGRALGVGVVNLVYLFNPDAVVFTGGVSRAGDLFLDPVRQALRAESFRAPFGHVRLRSARRRRLGSLGAALYSLEEGGQ
ncbi:MAG: ROK family protein [Elusimicrobiota bacterium]